MLQSHFDSFMELNCPLHSNIAVAVSGGSDSMALIHLAYESSHKIVALTVDHDLRPESSNEARQVRKWLQALSIEHHILINTDKTKPHSNKQEYARNLRYQLMSEWCKSHSITNLLVAHHAEDQAETILMRLERGSGLDGLCAMQPVSEYNNIRILRPLLDIPKQQLKNSLRTRNQQWIEDPSNKDDSYKRNRLRKAISAITEEDDMLLKRVNNSGKALSQAKETLDFVTDRYFNEYINLFEEGYILFQPSLLKECPKDLGLRILKRILCTIGSKIQMPRFEELDRCYESLIHLEPFKGCTLWGCQLIPKNDNNILVLRETSNINETIHISSGQTVIWDKRFLVALHKESAVTDLYISNITSSEALTSLYSIIEIEKEQLPKNIVRTIPIFFSDDDIENLENIVAIPHIGYYRDALIKDILSCQYIPTKDVEKTPILSVVPKQNIQ